MNNKLLISDDINFSRNFDGKVILWNEKSNKKNITSIPQYLEENKKKLREQLLELSHEVSIKNINNRSILEHLEIDSDFSYWWFTTLGQLEPFTNGKSIHDLLKLLCLKNILADQDNNKIYLHIRNKNNYFKISNVLSHYNVIDISKRNFANKILNYFNQILDIFVFFDGLIKFSFHSLQRFIFNYGKKNKTSSSKDIFFFDILAHYKVEANKFSSGYWANLKEYLDQKELRVEWNHIYFKSSKNSTIRKMVNICDQFDNHVKSSEHKILDSNISIKDYLETVKKICILFIKYKFILKNNHNHIFNLDSKDLKWNYFSLIESDLRKSLIGIRSYLNIYYFILMKNKISNIRNKPVCIYIQENQPWEYSLNYFWKKYINNKIIGVPHTTIPYFDFRYFFHKKTFGLWGYQPHLPQIMTLNGNDMELKLSEFSFLPSKLINVEALRYNYLNMFKNKNKKKNKVPKMLIIGDLVKEITFNHIEFIQKWLNKYKPDINILFRPHPAAIIDDYKNFEFFEFSNDSLLEDINCCDVFCVNNTTSAAADIYTMGLPLITYNELDRINFSPISDTDDHNIVSDIDSFNDCYNEILKTDITPRKYFELDQNIPSWKNLINKMLISNS